MAWPKFQTGYIVEFGDRSALSRGIKLFTTSPFEKWSDCSHVGLMYDKYNICEALAKVRIHDIDPRLQEGWRRVYRPIGLTDEQQAAIKEQCEYYRGKSYGWWKNGAHLLDGLCGGLYLFRRLCRVDNYPICSWLVAWVFERCVRPNFFGKPPNEVQPDDIDDWCSSHPGEFELIYARES